MSDDGLREIHLDGKQLVFLFMTATVVAVVIFLCGVLVGQGVRSGQAVAAAGPAAEGADPTLSAQTTIPAAPSNAPSDATQENLNYPAILGEAQEVPVELLSSAPAAAPTVEPEPGPAVPDRPPAERAAPTSAPRPRPAVAAAARSDSAATGPPLTEPPGSGFVVQVAAVRDRGDADGMARRLAAKGYPAFVTSPAGGPARIFRVRVGKYDTRKEAETVAARLEKEEQFKPWITR
jgi:cell division septation protein DedD